VTTPTADRPATNHPTAAPALPGVSAIVNNLNGMRYLPRLLETLVAQQGVLAEIIVVDRESTDGSLAFLAQRPQIQVISAPAASGLVAGYHAGVAAARHDLLFFCNEDLWLAADCLARLARHICIATRVGAADPWQWSYDGARLVHAGTRFVRATWDPISCYPPRRIDFCVPLAAGAEIPFGCAGAILVHRQMYLEAGGWDTTFFLDFEDVDLFLRAWQRGWRTVVEPAAKVYHAVGASDVQAGLPPGRARWRRRIAGESNRAVLCLKHFTGASLLWAAVVLLRPIAGNLLRLRLKAVRIHLAALRLTARRLPAVRRFRRANRRLAGTRPGQAFFTAAEFQHWQT
jgi:GT2 family glycosyltransferase